MKEGKDCIGVGLGALILNDKNEVLLMRRTQQSRNGAGQWWKPGGTLEFGSTPEACLIREIREELGCEAQIVRFLRYVNHRIPEEGQHWVALDFLVKITGEPQIMEPHKCDGMGWFPLNALPEETDETTTRSCIRAHLEIVKEPFHADKPKQTVDGAHPKGKHVRE